ncbi:MAG: CAP domain-containing protein, partial [Lachnospiraceae bacterium]|nr:CAP domain-containing protein [Lachnospiraceae bacterium]
MRKIKLVTKVLAYIVSVSIVIQSVPTYGAEKTAVNEFSTNEMYEVESSIEELSEIGTSIEEKYEAELSIEETEKSSEAESSTNEQVSEIESIEDKLSEVERSIEETEETSETEYSEEKFSSIEFVDEENSFVEESFTNSEEMFSDEETSEEELSTEEELCVIEYSNDGEYILGDPVMGEYGDYEGIVTYDLGTTSDNSYPTTPGVASRSFEEIKNYLKSSGASINDPVRYATNPVLKAPYASGALDDQTLNSGLAMVNQIRYIAGLSPVTLNSTYNKYAQSAALIQKLNGCLNHYPDKPEGIDEDLYKEGCLGSIKSNLAFSHSTLNYEILLYMNDSDNTNIDRVGHRRWLLFSNLHQIGLGKVGESSAAYVIGDDFSLESSVKGIVWPAQTMPINYFGKDHAWSVCIGEDVNQATASVKLTRVRDNKVWNFTQSGSDGYFNINNDYYGDVGCIIFRPNGIAGYSNGDTFNVEISYNNTKFTYTVNFFDVNQNIRKYTDEEKKELHRSLPNPKLYISSADTGNVYKLSEIALPEGWYWMHPDTNIYTQDSYNNYMVVYRKSGYEDYLDWVFISIVNLDNISVMGESTIGSRDMAVYSSSLGTDLKLADGTKITVRWELG